MQSDELNVSGGVMFATGSKLCLDLRSVSCKMAGTVLRSLLRWLHMRVRVCWPCAGVWFLALFVTERATIAGCVLTHLRCSLPPGRWLWDNDNLATLQANAFNGLTTGHLCVTTAQNAATHTCVCC